MARAEVTGRKPLVTTVRPKRKKLPPIADSDAVEAAHQHGPKASNGNSTPPIRGPPTIGAFSIDEFCTVFRLSESMYFKMRAQGLGPNEMQVGRRRMISFEAAERWRREREAATA